MALTADHMAQPRHPWLTDFSRAPVAAFGDCSPGTPRYSRMTGRTHPMRCECCLDRSLSEIPCARNSIER